MKSAIKQEQNGACSNYAEREQTRLKVKVTMKDNKGFKISQYACAVLLITSSIALVTYQVVHIDDVAGGLLYYVAQSFLLAGSIFGLDQYLKMIKNMSPKSQE